jgi:ribosomal protein L40E
LDVLTLLEEARHAGLRLRADGEQLVVEGPKSAAPIVERIRLRKPEVMAALREACCPACGRRAGPPLDIAAGCESHNVSAEDVARWWQVAEERDIHVSACHCCAGPAPSGALTCRKCEE